MKTKATQNILLNKFYNTYLKDINETTNGTDNSNDNIDNDNMSSVNNESVTLAKHQILVISHHGKKGYHTLNSFREGMRKMLPHNVKLQITFISRKFGTSYQIKGKSQPRYRILQ